MPPSSTTALSAPFHQQISVSLFNNETVFTNLQLLLEWGVLDFALQCPAHPGFEPVFEDLFFHHFQFDEIFIIPRILGYQLFVRKLDFFVWSIFSYSEDTVRIFSAKWSLAFLFLLTKPKAKISSTYMKEAIRCLAPANELCEQVYHIFIYEKSHLLDAKTRSLL
jgi:hypothetical protein